MADSTISALPPAAALAGTEPLPIDQGGITVKATAQDVANLFDASDKADKVLTPTAGNFAGLDSSGNLTDSGSKAADFDASGAASGAVSGHELAYDHTEIAQALAVTKTLYVDVGRGDTYTADGSQPRPYKTIQAAVDALAVLDSSSPYEISIANGHYVENLLLQDLKLRHVTLTGKGIVRISPLTGSSLQSAANNDNLATLHINNIIFDRGVTIVGTPGTTAFADTIFNGCSFVSSSLFYALCINNISMFNCYNEKSVSLLNVSWFNIDGGLYQGSFTLSADSAADVPSGGVAVSGIVNGVYHNGTPTFTIGGTGTISLGLNGVKWGGSGSSVTIPAGLTVIAQNSVLRTNWTNNGALTLRNSMVTGTLTGTGTTTRETPASQLENDSSVTGTSIKDALETLDGDKADIVIPSAAGNIAGLSAGGNLTDSGLSTAVIGRSAFTASAGTAGDYATLDAALDAYAASSASYAVIRILSNQTHANGGASRTVSKPIELIGPGWDPSGTTIDFSYGILLNDTVLRCTGLKLTKNSAGDTFAISTADNKNARVELHGCLGAASLASSSLIRSYAASSGAGMMLVEVEDCFFDTPTDSIFYCLNNFMRVFISDCTSYSGVGTWARQNGAAQGSYIFISNTTMPTSGNTFVNTSGVMQVKYDSAASVNETLVTGSVTFGKLSNPAQTNGFVTTVGTPGLDTNFPSEKAVRDAVDAKIAKSVGAAAGDLITFTAASTPSNVGIGSAGQVLTVVAGAPAWAAATGGAVTSVFGRTSAVVAAASDYNASEVDNDSARVPGSFVDDALDNLDGKATALTYAGIEITPALTSGRVFTITLTKDTDLVSPSGTAATGMIITVIFLQDGTGGWTVTYKAGSSYRDGNLAFGVGEAIGETSYASWRYNGTNWDLVEMLDGYGAGS